MLIGFRFIVGCSGSTPLTLAAGTIADIIEQERRGATMSFLAMGPLLDPIIDPVSSSYLSQARNWHWVFRLLAIIGSAGTTEGALIMSKAYAPPAQDDGNLLLRSRLDSGLRPRMLFARSIIRLMKLLALSAFTALGYSYLCLLFTTFSDVFGGRYGFSTGTVGLTFLGLGIGSLVGLGAVGVVSDSVFRRKVAAGEGEMPEFRLLPMVYFSPFMCVGLFWYG